MMDKLKMHSPDGVEANIERLANLFPDCVVETRDAQGNLKRGIDFDQLRQALSDHLVEGPQERYRLDWPGKREALLAANAPIAKTLRPCREESMDFDTTQNLFVEGDNLEALKLLQETYLGRVNMIYIDPPYNTGNDFIYVDDFATRSQDYFARSKQRDDYGRLVANTESNGRFHSDWLSMLAPRLRLARSLLTADGVVFISIDDGELATLKLVCDEVFGSENFVNVVSINMKNVAGASGGGEDKRLKKNAEYLLIYARDYAAFGGFFGAYEFTPLEELLARYRETGVSWKYTSVLVDPGIKDFLGSTVDGDGNDIRVYVRRGFVIKSIGQLSRELGIGEIEAYERFRDQVFQTAMPQSSIRPRVMKLFAENNRGNELCSIEYVPRSGRNKGVLYEQFYRGENFRLFAWLKDVCEIVGGRLCKKDMQGTMWNFASETKNLTKEGEIPFPNGKKPLRLMRQILDLVGDPNLLAMDFFAGSGTLGHAVMDANAQDGGARRFILVQLDEPLNEAGKEHGPALEICDSIGVPRVVSELTKERLRRSAKALRQGRQDLDTGFRVLKIDTSNMAEVYYRPDQLNQGDLLSLVENVKSDRSAEDLLFQVLLDWGVDLGLPIARETLVGREVFFVDGDALAACFVTDGSVDEAFVRALAQRKPLRAVFRDRGFANDSARINAGQIFKALSPHTDIRTL